MDARFTHFIFFLSIALGTIRPVFSQKKVTGTVSDKAGLLPGVNVLVKGTDNAVETGFDGDYSIMVKDEDFLVFSYLGMKSVEVEVGRDTIIDIVLQQSKENVLEEVVITGITSTDKRLFTGASKKIKAKEVGLDGMSEISQSLEGKISGVSVQNVSATFGAEPKIRVRGLTSIYGSSKPLWVVDGVIVEDVLEISADDLSTGDVATLISSAIAGINPDDIESFDILKDGSATSIYGARAMGGVIVVTTKKGEYGKTSVNYLGEFSYRLLPRYEDFNIINSQGQMSIYEDMQIGGWLDSVGILSVRQSGVYGKMHQMIKDNVLQNDDKAKAQYLGRARARNTNWFRELFQENIMQTHAVNMSTATERASYYGSISALVDPGWAKSSEVNRYTVNFNSSFNVTPRLIFNALTNVSYRKQKAPGTLAQTTDVVTGEVKRDFDINPYLFALNASRALSSNEDYTRNFAPFNIIYELDQNYIDLNIVDLKLQGETKYKLLLGMETSLLGALKYQSTAQEHIITEFSNQAEAYRAMKDSIVIKNNPFLYLDPKDPLANPISILPKGGVYDRSDYRMLSYDLRGTASYKKTIQSHILNLYLGGEINATNRKRNHYTGWGVQYALGEKPFYISELFKKGIENNDYYYRLGNTRYRNIAGFTNLTYSYDRRYTINTTLRYEGTNKLGKSNKSRWLPTWNISGAWNLNKEEFFDKIQPIFSDLLLKISYSLTADRGPNYVTNSLVDIRSYTPWRPFEDYKESGLFIKSLENRELTYEKKNELNLGVELGLINNRIKTTLDWYDRNNYDLIGLVTTQGLGGEVLKYGNVANMTSSGVDLSLRTKNIVTEKFSWITDFVYSKMENKVTRLESQTNIIDLVTGNGFAVEGYPVRSIFSIPFKGLDKEGLPIFLDHNGNETTTGIFFQDRANVNTLKYSGSADPTDIGGLGNTFIFNRLKLNTFVTYSFGNVIRLTPVFDVSYSDDINFPKEFANRWHNAGDENYTNIPVIATKKQVADYGYYELATAYNAYNYSDVRIAKGDFIKLKEVSLEYSFGKSFLKNMKLQNMSIKLQAKNLVLLYSDSKLNGQDPEFFNAGGVALPSPKQFTFTFRVGL